MQKISVDKPTRLISQFPVCLVTSKSGEAENVFTASWIMPVSNKPAMVALNVEKTRYSHEIIKKSGAFVLNIPHRSMLKEAAYCGNVSGRDKNKFAEMNLEKELTEHSNIILPKCLAYLECKVAKEVDIADRTIFIAEVISCGAETGLFEKGTWIISPKTETLLYLGDGKYCTTKQVSG